MDTLYMNGKVVSNVPKIPAWPAWIKWSAALAWSRHLGADGRCWLVKVPIHWKTRGKP